MLYGSVCVRALNYKVYKWFVKRFQWSDSATVDLLFQDAVCTLNTLQTNASVLEQVRRERGPPQHQLQAMKGFLQRAGLTVSPPLSLFLFLSVSLSVPFLLYGLTLCTFSTNASVGCIVFTLIDLFVQV